MSDRPISDDATSETPREPGHSTPVPAGRRAPARQQPDQPPPVDPTTLEDYHEFVAWKRARAERERTVQADAAIDVEQLKIEIPDGDQVHEFLIVDLDEDVLAHLQVLATFADTDMDRAAAIFEALLGPVEYERLRRTVRPMFRRIAGAHQADPENNPSVAEVWTSMATAVSQPIQELARDPKRIDSLRGPSATGPASRSTSPASALPPVT